MTQKPCAYSGTEPYIFISYAHADDAVVLPLIRGLQNGGFRVWYDEGISDAELWQKVVAEHLKNSCFVIAFVSRAALESPNCRKEINYAVNLSERSGKRAKPLPVYLDDASMDAEMEMVLLPLQSRYYYKYSGPEAFLESLKSSAALQTCREAADGWDTIGFAGEEASAPVETPEDWCKQADKLYDEEKYAEALVLYRKAAYRGHAKAQNTIGVCYFYGRGVDQSYSEAVKWYTMAAEQGYAAAQSNLGNAYDMGRGVERDYGEAVKWYRLAAEQGHASGQAGLGFCYYHGHGVEKDYAEAVKWYRLAVEGGNASACLYLGHAYYCGNGAPEDKAEAVRWYRMGAERGSAGAQRTLGECYFYGWGIERDYAEAAKWYRMAAEKGNGQAQYCLGECYERGFGVAQDIEQALYWYRKANEKGQKKAERAVARCEKIWIELTGSPEDWYQLGLKLIDDMRGVEAGPLLRKAAEQGHVGAMYRWGLYCLPIFVKPKESEEGKRWVVKAAELGNADAQEFLGKEHYIGMRLKQDYAEAVKWLRLAARQGSTEAKYYLGLCYYYGQGVERSYGDAFGWLFGAVSEGHEKANYNLGLCYEFGNGTVKNYRQAVECYAKLADRDDMVSCMSANCGIGRCYYYGGNGITQDYGEAVKWFRKAAQMHRGYTVSFGESRFYLGNCYTYGWGVPQSYTEAKKWYEEGAKYNHSRAEMNLGLCYETGRGVEKRDLNMALQYYRRAKEHGHSKADEAIRRCEAALK